MKKRAFTLIELLVVVLIIGILSAIALPQYKIAVAKARYTNLMTLAESIFQAQTVYKLANGQYSMDFHSLDVQLPDDFTDRKTTEDGRVFYMTNDKMNCFFATHDDGNNGSGVFCFLSVGIRAGYGHWYGRSTSHCIADKTANDQNDFCKRMTGKTSASDTNGGWNLYAF